LSPAEERERFPVFARNRYFTGKLLGAEDFAEEQEYLLGKDRLRNRMLHGWGVVAGLAVVGGKSGSEVVVEPGLALDGWGREIVVSSPCRLDLSSAGGGDERRAHGRTGDNWVTIHLAYAEFDRDPVPSPIEGEAPVFGTIVEGHTVLVEPGLPEPPGTSGAALPQDPSVVLATVRPSSGHVHPRIDATYRRELRSNAELLEIIGRLEEQVARSAAERRPVDPAGPMRDGS
jgi:hypothetical protein